MQKKFVTNLAFLLFLNLLIKPFWVLGIDRAVQVATGAEVYGAYYALFNFSFLFNIFLDLGITNFNNRNISQNRHLLDKHLSGIIILRLALALVYFGISFALSLIIGYDAVQQKMLMILLFNQVLISFILYLRSNLAGLQLFRTDSIISVLDRFIMIVICSALLWGNVTKTPFRIEWFIWAQTVAYVFTIAIILMVLSGKSAFRKLYWKPAFALMILKKSYPFAILILLMTFYNRIDSVMIERLLVKGAKQAGIYAQAYRLLDAANMIAYLFASLLLPMFSHMIKMKEDIRGLLRLAYSLIAIPAFTVVCLSVLFRNEIMGMLYSDHIEESSNLFAILMCCFFAISTTYIFGTLLTANGNLKQLNIMAGVGMLMNIVLNLMLIPRWEAQGAAVASLATQSITALVQIGLCYKVFRLSPDPPFLSRMMAFMILTLAATWGLKSVVTDWKTAVACSIVFAAITSFSLRLLHWGAFMTLLRNRG